MDTFTTTQICKVLKISLLRLRGWIIDTPGFFEPSIKKSSGPGRPAIYSKADVYSFAIFKQLIEGQFSLSREAAARIVNSIRNSRQASSGFEAVDAFLILATVDGKIEKLIPRWATAKNDGIPLNLPMNGVDPVSLWDEMLIINMRKIRSLVDQAIKEQ